MVKKLEEVLRKAPFNSGFGLYLYQMKNAVRNVHPNADTILKDITGNLIDFDVYHLTENLTNQLLTEMEEETAKMAEKFRSTYSKFIKDFRKHFDNRHVMRLNVVKLLEAANTNNILHVKRWVRL